MAIPLPHRAAADHSGRGNGARRRSFKARDFRGFALGEEYVTQGLVLWPGAKLQENLALPLCPFIERQFGCGPDRGDDGGRGIEATELFRVLHGEGSIFRVIDFGCLHFAGAPWGLARYFECLFACGLHEIAIRELVDQSHLKRGRCRNRIAQRDDLQCMHHADQTRQVLRPPSARHQAKLYFRQTKFGARNCDAVMTRHGDLEPTAQCGAMDRGDHRLFRILDDIDDFSKERFGRRLPELLEVGTGKERPPGAGNDQCGHVSLGIGPLHALYQRNAHGLRDRINRRVVERKNGYWPVTAPTGNIAHQSKTCDGFEHSSAGLNGATLKVGHHPDRSAKLCTASGPARPTVLQVRQGRAVPARKLGIVTADNHDPAVKG